VSSIERFCGEPKISEAKMGVFENRIAEYKDVFEKWKLKKTPICRQKDDN
jgi:hypothetical protein